MKHRLQGPSRLVDLNSIEMLRFIEAGKGVLRIGATTIHEAVAESAVVKQAISAISALAGGIGDVQVRHRGTIGGSISNNDPAACYPSAVLGLGATVRTNRRQIPADDFFTGMFETALAKGELVTEIEFPLPDAACYMKFPNMASRFSIVGVFLARFGNRVRVAVTGAAPAVFRATEFEARLSADFRPEAINGLAIAADGLIADVHGTREYRAHMVGVLTQRAVTNCLEATR